MPSGPHFLYLCVGINNYLLECWRDKQEIEREGALSDPSKELHSAPSIGKGLGMARHLG